VATRADDFGDTLARVDAARLMVELEREDDGRWIGEVRALPGVMAYGRTRDEALARTEALALRVLADRLEHGETVPELNSLFGAA
jgi:predicted RNase H-like HicB family nuclease